jgi:hypothetical protein
VKLAATSSSVVRKDSWGTGYEQQVEKAAQPVKGSKKGANKATNNAPNASEQVAPAPLAEQPAPRARPRPRLKILALPTPEPSPVPTATREAKDELIDSVDSEPSVPKPAARYVHAAFRTAGIDINLGIRVAKPRGSSKRHRAKVHTSFFRLVLNWLVIHRESCQINLERAYSCT